MQLGLVRTRITHLRDFLPLSHGVTLFHEPFAVMAIGAEETLIMFDNDELPVAHQPGTAVDHLTRGSGLDCLTRPPADVYAVISRTVLGEPHEE